MIPASKIESLLSLASLAETWEGFQALYTSNPAFFARAFGFDSVDSFLDFLVSSRLAVHKSFVDELRAAISDTSADRN